MTKSLLEDKRTIWIVVAVTSVLFLIANLPWQLDDYDQAKQAFTSFEMIKEGHWFYQRTPHEHVATKPPVVGWISAALFALTRSWEVAWRLPSFVAAVAIAVLLFRAGHSMDGRGANRIAPGGGEDEGEGSSSYATIVGLIAVSAFGLNLLSPRLATLVRTDMPLALVIFLIGLLIWRKIQKEETWKPRDRIYIFALLTAAMLIKGPIVYAFLLPGIVIMQWGKRRQAPNLPPEQSVGSADEGDCSHGAVSPCGESRAERLDTARRLHGAWFGWWPWIASLGIFLFWVIGGILFQPGFYNEVVIREFIGRFGETIHRPQPLYFYLAHLLHKFAPWSVLMIALAAFDLMARRWRICAAVRELSPETLWVLCWSLGGLVVMSLIPSKRVDRIFPIIPPLCLLLAAQISARHIALPRKRSGVSAASGPYLWIPIVLVLSIMVSGGYTISKVVAGYRDHRDALVLFGRDVRHEAEVHHWRYEVVSAKDEGLLPYLRRTHFFSPDRAIPEWNRGNLEALVVPAEQAPALMRELHDAALSQLKSNERRGEQGRSYVLITR